MNFKFIIVLFFALIMLLNPAYGAAFHSYGLPESKALMFGSPDGTGTDYYAPYIDSDGKLKISTIDAVTALTISVIDTVEVVEMVEVVSEVSNVTSVDLVDTITTITGGNIDIDYLTEGFISEVDRGNIAGVSLVSVSSFHTELSSSFELISASNSPEVMLSTAEAVNVSSSAAADDKDLTGALSLTLFGSNVAGERISETIDLEGLASQETTLKYFCIDNIQIGTVGSGDAAAGDLYVYEADAAMTSGVPDGNPLAKIPIGYGACGNGKFMVPTGDTAVLVDLAMCCSGTGPYEVLVMRQAYGSAEPARMIADFMADDGAETFKINAALDANDYIYFLAKSANAGDDISVRARFLVY